MTVEITEFLRERLEGSDSGPMTVKVIPVPRGWPSGQGGVTENLLEFERLVGHLRLTHPKSGYSSLRINLVTVGRRASGCSHPAEGASQ
jgi:hypothetical protein